MRKDDSIRIGRPDLAWVMRKVIKKLFGGLNLTWKNLVIFALIAGVYTAVVCILPITKNTSFHDIGETFEVWILCGIIIIMNSESNLDAALKCFVFFLISQPLVYLLQVPFSSMGWHLFIYYKYWFIWTLLTLPMGFVGYFLKKQKNWGLVILVPMLLILAYQASSFFSQMLFWPPRHVLSLIGCFFTMYASVLCIFDKNKKVRRIGVLIDLILTAGIIVLGLVRPFVYNTTILTSGGSKGVVFDDTWEASLADPKKGDLQIQYYENLEDYALVAEFRHAGETQLIMEAPDGEKKVFDLIIEPRYYTLTEVEE